MYTPEQIMEMGLDDLKADFFNLMNGIVSGYGDDQSLPVVCPGQEGLPIFLPGQEDESVSLNLPV